MRWAVWRGNAPDGVMGADGPITIVGFVGVALIVAAYFANQQDWLRSDDWRFPLPIWWDRC